MKHYLFKTIAIGGTFDRLHKGHRFFISEAFELGERVIIGLTSDEYAIKKLKVKSKKLKVKRSLSEVTPPRCVNALLGRCDEARNRVKTPPRWRNHKGALRHLPGGPLRRSSSEASRMDSWQVEEFVKRKEELEQFLKQKGLLERAEIVKIHDVYGPAADSCEIEALIVTSETIKGGRQVNRRRKLKNLKPLKLLKIPLVLAEDKKRIASTRIRFGEIDRWGRVFLRSKIKNQKSKRESLKNTSDGGPAQLGLLRGGGIGIDGTISEGLRQILKKPQGILIKGDPQNHQAVIPEIKKQIGKLRPIMISTVGDEVTKLCNQAAIPINLAIIDYKVRRKRKYHSLSELGFALEVGEARKTPQGWPSSAGIPPGVEGAVIAVRNPPGHITLTLIAAIRKSIKAYLTNGRQKIIKVIGEEDLSGVPAILLSPLGSVVLYGQPEEGIVMVEVTEKRKECLIDLIERHQRTF